MSVTSSSFDRRIDQLQDALTMPMTWPRGRKAPSVGNFTSLKQVTGVESVHGEELYQVPQADILVRTRFGRKE